MRMQKWTILLVLLLGVVGACVATNYDSGGSGGDNGNGDFYTFDDDEIEMRALSDSELPPLSNMLVDSVKIRDLTAFKSSWKTYTRHTKHNAIVFHEQAKVYLAIADAIRTHVVTEVILKSGGCTISGWKEFEKVMNPHCFTPSTREQEVHTESRQVKMLHDIKYLRGDAPRKPDCTYERTESWWLALMWQELRDAIQKRDDVAVKRLWETHFGNHDRREGYFNPDKFKHFLQTRVQQEVQVIRQQGYPQAAERIEAVVGAPALHAQPSVMPVVARWVFATVCVLGGAYVLKRVMDARWCKKNEKHAKRYTDFL